MSKKKFQKTNGKLTGISILNAKGTILKKINVSFIVHFCIDKYSFNLYKFEHTLYAKVKSNITFLSF